FPEGESGPASEDPDQTVAGQGKFSRTLDPDDEIEMDEKSESRGEPEKTTLEKTFKEAREKAKKQQEDLDFRKNSLKADILLKRYTGLGQVMGGMGQIISGGLEFGSHQKDADEKDDEAGAAKAASQVDDAANFLKNIDDLISGVRQTFSQMIEAKNEAMN